MELRLRGSSSTDKVFVLFSLCSLCSPWFKFQRTIDVLKIAIILQKRNIVNIYEKNISKKRQQFLNNLWLSVLLVRMHF